MFFRLFSVAPCRISQRLRFSSVDSGKRAGCDVLEPECANGLKGNRGQRIFGAQNLFYFPCATISPPRSGPWSKIDNVIGPRIGFFIVLDTMRNYRDREAVGACRVALRCRLMQSMLGSSKT